MSYTKSTDESNACLQTKNCLGWFGPEDRHPVAYREKKAPRVFGYFHIQGTNAPSDFTGRLGSCAFEIVSINVPACRSFCVDKWVVAK
jgi:hypothetical protein